MKIKRQKKVTYPRATVTSWNDVRENLLMFERYRVSPNADLRSYYQAMISRGACFVVYDYEQKKLFGPSRFLGYVSNTRAIHEANPYRDGRETNPAIEKSLAQRFEPSAMLESEFSAFCQAAGHQPLEQETEVYSRQLLAFGSGLPS